MKRALILVLAAGVAFAVAALVHSVNRAAAIREARWKAQQAAWESEKADLELFLDQAQAQLARTAVVPRSVQPVQEAAPTRPTPQDILADLQALSLASGKDSTRRLRQAVYGFEQLLRLGPEALPAIRAYLRRYEDLELDTSPFQGRGARDKVPLDFVVPPTLRFGLFDVVRRIGGAEAEAILGEALVATGRGAEVSYLAHVLQQMAPGKYRDSSVMVARALLAQANPASSASPIDQYHRNYLYGVLSLFGDTGYAGVAESQLIQSDSQIDRAALKYLQDTLGAQAMPIITQAYQNPLLTNSTGKEPLARLALSFVGADAQANSFYELAINDPLLTTSHRKNLIEDLNQDGFADTRNLTPNDLPLIENRMSLIEQLAPSAMDDVNAAAFQEAYKDLVNMRAKILGDSAGP